MIKPKNSISIFLFVLCWCITWFIFGKIFVHPNDYMMVSTGDGLMIYFDSIWQCKWGQGMYLEGMNYPHKELLPMSGGQAFFAWFFGFINQHLFFDTRLYCWYY